MAACIIRNPNDSAVLLPQPFLGQSIPRNGAIAARGSAADLAKLLGNTGLSFMDLPPSAADPPGMVVPSFSASLTLFVDPNGSATSLGLSASTPTTLDAALAMSAAGLNLTIQMAAGTYSPAAGLRKVLGQVTLVGQWVDSGGGTRTVGVGSTTSSIVDNAGGLVANANEGRRIRFLTGARTGDVQTVRSNTTTNNVLMRALLGAPAQNDTYVLEMAGVTINMPNTGTNARNVFGFDCSAGVMIWQGGIKVFYPGTSTGPNLSFRGGSARLSGVECDFGASNGAITFDQCYGNIGTTYAGLNASGAPLQFLLGNQGAADIGCYFHSTGTPTVSWLGTGGLLFASVLASVRVQVTGTFVSINNCEFHGNTGAGAACVLYDEGASGTIFSNNFSNNTNCTCAVKIRAGFGYLFNNTFATLNADAILVNNAYVWCDTNTSTGSIGTGVGVRLQMNAKLRNDGSNTVTGTAGDTQIGGNAAVTAWGAIANPTTDAAAAAPQFCLAHTTTTA